MDERKFATVLFADFVDSTGVGARHDPEVIRSAYRAMFSEMRDILVAHGGTVEKFIGDAVMAVFGVPTTHEDDPLRAVRAAFALQDHIRRSAQDRPVRIGLRVGVNTGEVVAGTAEASDFLVTGTPVNLGARLQSAASPGQVLVGSLTRDLVSAHVRFGDELAVDAKGFGRVSAWPALELLREPVLRSVRSATLVDRDAETRDLLAAYDRVRTEQRPQLVTIVGPPGVGKSRLINEFVAQGALGPVRRGRCVAYRDGITPAPLHSMLRADAGVGPGDRPEDAIRKVRDAAEAALGGSPDEADRVARRLLVLAGVADAHATLTDVPQESVAQELDWALRRYLEQRSAAEPVTLIFEDVQWAEAALLDTIEHVVEWTRGAVLILCVARPEFLEERSSWGRGANATVLPLQPLSSEDTAQLVAVLLPPEHAGAKTEIVQRSEGNPLYAEELVRLQLQGGPAVAAVPATLQGLIAARLDAAPRGVKSLVERASVIGRVFWTDALGELGVDRADMRAHLLEAIRRDFIVDLRSRGPAGGWAYRFTHSLTRDVAYASLAKSDRAALHDRLSRWLETTGRPEELETIASHAEQAFVLASEIGMPTAPELGERATALLLSAARAVNARADYRVAHSLFERAIRVGEASGADDRLLLEARGRVAGERLRRESSRDALEEVHRVLAEARAHGPSATLASLLQWSAVYAPYSAAGDGDALHRESVAVARAVGDPVLLASVLRSSARPQAARGDLEEERRILLEARDLLDGQSDGKRLLARVLLDLARNATARGQFSDAQRDLDVARPLVEDLVGRVLANGAAAEFWRAIGELTEARSSAQRAQDAATELGSPSAIADSAVVLGRVLRELGEAAEAGAVLSSALSTARGRAPDAMLVRVHSELARTALVLGSIVDARSHAESALAAEPTDLASVQSARAAFALVAAADGATDEAVSALRVSIAALGVTTLRLDAALARLDCARVLIAADRGSEARPLLQEVLAFYGDPLAGRKQDEVRTLLHQCERVPG